jgi:hypothetical protein
VTNHVAETVRGEPGVCRVLLGVACHGKELAMKSLWFVPAFLGAMVLTGCSGGAEDKLAKAKEAMKAEVEVLHKEMKEHLDKLEPKYAEWKAKAATATGEAKEKMEAELAALGKHMSKVKDQLANLKTSAPEMWKDSKEEMHKAVSGLKDAFEKGKEHFK